MIFKLNPMLIPSYCFCSFYFQINLRELSSAFLARFEHYTLSLFFYLYKVLTKSSLKTKIHINTNLSAS